MKTVLIITALSLTGIVSSAQQFATKSARISFYSSAPLENIEAVNRSASAVINSSTGDVQFSVLMKGFEFRKALMQEHFNSKFVESDKYPRGSFKGKIINNSSVNYSVNGTYPVTVAGKLSIHGVENSIETPGKITVQDGKLTVNAVFNILLADYRVSIPKMYRDNISKSIRITANATLDSM